MLREILKERNLKATHQRVIILSIIEQNGHIGIDDIYIELKKVIPTISLATLYRNINDLLEKKVLTELKLDNQKIKYEITKDHHIHSNCLKCGSIKDIYDNEIFDILKTKITGEIISYSIVVNVFCNNVCM